MSYQEALQAAGGNVVEFKTFGDYQGTWWAKVAYGGEYGWVSGSYGSCSGCDAFEAEFSDTNSYSIDPNDKEAQRSYDQRLALFGQSYLTALIPQAQAEKELCREIEQNEYNVEEFQEILNFLREKGWEHDEIAKVTKAGKRSGPLPSL